MIPAHLVPLVATFRPQLQHESDREYLRAALSNAQNKSLVALERLVNNLQVTFGSAQRHDLR